MSTPLKRFKITKCQVDSLPLTQPGQPATVYRDTEIPGFCLRVGEKSKTFYINRRVNGKPAWIKIGTYGAITPEQARRRARQMLGLMESGINPNEERKTDALRGKTLRDSLEDYLKTNIQLSQRSAKDYRVIILRYTGDPEKYPYMNWLERPVSTVTRMAFREAYEKLGEQTPSGAEHLRSALHAIYNFMVEQYDGKIVSENPIKIRKEFRYRLRPKDNRIADSHLPAFLHALQNLSANNGAVTADFLLFTLLNGLRKNEAATLKWMNVDFVMGHFTIPATKNHKPHILPITNASLEILQRRNQAKTGEYVFSDTKGDGHLKDPRKALVKVITFINREVYPQKEIPSLYNGYFKQDAFPEIYFTIHDLRRTFAGIARGEVGGDLTSRLLNHISGQEGAAVTKRHYLGEDSATTLRIPLERVSRKIMMIAGYNGIDTPPEQKQQRFHRSSFVTSLFM